MSSITWNSCFQSGDKTKDNNIVKLDVFDPQTPLDKYVYILCNYKRMIVLLSVILILIGGYFGPSAFNELSSGGFASPNAESTIAQKKLSNDLVYPDYDVIAMLDGSSLGLVVDDVEYQHYYNDVITSLQAIGSVANLISLYNFTYMTQFVSDDRYKSLIVATIRGEPNLYKLKSAIEITPLKATLGGTVPFGLELSDGITKGVKQAEFSSIPIIFVLLILSLGGIFSGLMPWYAAIGGVLFPLCFLVGLGKHMNISGVSATIVTMFGLGLGIDYALFMVSRFMQERENHPNLAIERIAKRTLETSGRTIMFSALTVFFALSGGLLFQEYFLSSICLAVMCCSTAAAIGACSNLVSMLALLDKLLFRYQTPKFTTIVIGSLIQSKSDVQVSAQKLEDGDGNGSIEAVGVVKPLEIVQATVQEDRVIHQDFTVNVWRKIGEFVLAYPLSIFLLSMSFLVAMTIVYFTTIQYGLTDNTVLPISSPSRQVYEAIHDTSIFPTYGKSNIYVFIATNPTVKITSKSFIYALANVTSTIESIDQSGIVRITSLVNLGTLDYTLNDYINLYTNTTIESYDFKGYPSSTNNALTSSLLTPFKLSDFQTLTYIEIATKYIPYSSDAKNLARSIRSYLHGENPLNDLVGYVGVTGDPAITVDLYASFNERIPYWMTILLLSVFVLLLLMTRSIVIPLKAVVLSVLSLGATFGVLQLLFILSSRDTQDTLGFRSSGYISGGNVIFIFSIAFGLSVDYEVFIISRIQEHYRKVHDTKEAILVAMSETGGIITSAAVMLAVTTFAFIGCIVSFIKYVGVGIAIAVVIDATIVRILLVPTCLVLLDTYNWWCPQWLGRVIDYIGLTESESSLVDLNEYEVALKEDMNPDNNILNESNDAKNNIVNV